MALTSGAVSREFLVGVKTTRGGYARRALSLQQANCLKVIQGPKELEPRENQIEKKIEAGIT